jgi:hypothetical protein
MRYTTEYEPQISDKCKKIIKDNIGSTLESIDSYAYNLEYVYEWLQENASHMTSLDLKVIKGLIAEKVDYIEF